MAKKITAFTLIELLFVIAIIGVLATFSMATAQQRAQKTKIEKAALQIEQILQAAQSYYTDNGCWPNGVGCKIDPQHPLPSFASYLPFNDIAITNPWGGQYAYGPVFSEGTEKTFRVCTAKDLKDRLSQAITSHIAHLLPNGRSIELTTVQDCKDISIPSDAERNPCKSLHNCIAVAEVGKPGGDSSPSPGPDSNFIFLRSADQVYHKENLQDTGVATFDVPAQCPDKWQPDIFASISWQESPQSKMDAGVRTPYKLGFTKNCSLDKCSINLSYQCILKIPGDKSWPRGANGCTHDDPENHSPDGAFTLSYIVFCKKNI